MCVSKSYGLEYRLEIFFQFTVVSDFLEMAVLHGFPTGWREYFSRFSPPFHTISKLQDTSYTRGYNKIFYSGTFLLHIASRNMGRAWSCSAVWQRCGKQKTTSVTGWISNLVCSDY